MISIPNRSAKIECIGTIKISDIAPNPLKLNPNFSSNLAVLLSANINLPKTMMNGSKISGKSECFCFNNLIENQKHKA